MIKKFSSVGTKLNQNPFPPSKKLAKPAGKNREFTLFQQLGCWSFALLAAVIEFSATILVYCYLGLFSATVVFLLGPLVLWLILIAINYFFLNQPSEDSRRQ